MVNCVGKVFTFGDANDPSSEVAKKVKETRPMKPDFKTKPSVYYIPVKGKEWEEL